MIVQARINSALHLKRADLPPGMAAQIRQRLTIPNGEKPKMIKMGIWGAADLPDGFELWGDIGEDLVTMRGFAAELRAGLEMSGCQVSWIDETVAPPIPITDLLALRSPTLWPDQERFARAILQHRQGVIQAPVASGKTVAVLETWRRAGVTGLVLVDKKGLAQQWRERSAEHIGYEPGFIGDGVWEEKPLTIAMVQTIYRRHEKLEREGWFKRWGMTVFDECQHAIAPSLREIIACVLSRYLVGVTATPLEGDWRQAILLNALGPIFHQTHSSDLRKTGRHVVPLVKVVRTDFKWVPNARDAQLIDSRAIYRRIIEALQQDEARLELIARTIVEQPASCAQLVVCKRLGYLGAIRAKIERMGYSEQIMMMRGEESADRRLEIAEIADGGHCVILATVADEGVDIPRLDRLHLTWPQRKALTITQQVGRIQRHHPEKQDSVVIDYADLNQGVLRSQSYSRRAVYRKSGFPIEGESNG